MKEILFRKNFNHYQSVKYKDSNKIFTDENGEFYQFLFPKFEQQQIFQDQGTFEKEFNNPLFGLIQHYCLICVEEYDNKVSFKFFHGYKEKKVGKLYYQVSKNLHFITVNKNTGDVYFGFIQNYQKKRKKIKSLRKNYFGNSPITNLTRIAKNFISDISNGKSGAEVVNEASELFLNRVTNYIRNQNLTREEILIKYNFDKKGIKYPNNFKIFVPHILGKDFRKLLKKNDNLLVETFMEFHKLQGKKIKKYLHEATSLNVSLYLCAKSLFGEDWLNQDGDVILKLLNSPTETDTFNFSIQNIFSSIELKRVYFTFKKSFIDNEINAYTFVDHIKMYIQLKTYGEKIKWVSDGNDYTLFQKEHLDWTDKLDYYRKGTYQRIYPEYFYNELDIDINGFFPIILDQSKSYNDESMTQSNCVKTYIGRASSFIVSLRKGSKESDVRATIEYKITKSEDGSILANRYQSLGKFNMPLENFWLEPLLKLDEKIISLYSNKALETVKIKKTCLNGIDLISDSFFDEKGHLVWTYKKNSNYLQEEW